MKVIFNSVEEFLVELRANNLKVLGPVRSTKRFTGSKSFPTLRQVEVVAGYLIEQNGPMLVELARYCGELWSNLSEEDPGKSTLAKADEILKQISDACRELKLEERAGQYLEEKAL